MTFELTRRHTLSLIGLGLGAATLNLGGIGRVLAQDKDSVTIAWPSDVPSWDPCQRTQPDAQPIYKMLFEQPVMQDPDLNFVPGLLTEWSLADDGLAFAFKVREGVRFHDGSPLTAHDIRFNWHERVQESLNGGNKIDSANVWKNVTDITVDDDHAGTFHFSAPMPTAVQWLAFMANFVVPKDYIQKVGIEAFREKPVGTGPYKLVEYQINSRMVFERNEDYWGEPAAYDRIVLRNVNNAQQQKANIEGGESQIALDIPGRIAEGMESDTLKVQSSPSPEVLYLEAGAATADPDVVEAIKLGIDYEALRTLVGAGAKEATGIIPSMMLGSLPEGEGPESDPEAAKKLLADAGKTGTEVTLDYANDYTRLAGIDYNVLAQGIQTQLEAIGLKVTLNPTPTSTSLQRYVDGETEMALWSWPPDIADPSDVLVFAPGNLIGTRVHWPAEAAPEVAELAEQARVATGDDREAAFTAWNKAMNEQAPFAYLLEPSFFLVASTSVEQVSHDPLAAINLSQIR